MAGPRAGEGPGTRAGAASDRLREGYRLTLQRELGRTDGRDDGVTTPDELDIAWRVGGACPELSAEARHGPYVWRGRLAACRSRPDVATPSYRADAPVCHQPWRRASSASPARPTANVPKTA